MVILKYINITDMFNWNIIVWDKVSVEEIVLII